MSEFFEIALSLATLTILEVVLGVDNLIFIAIITQRLPSEKRKAARQWGLTFAWVTRLLLLASAVWVMQLTHPFMTIMGFALSGRDLFLLAGGLFLIAKATQEINAEIAPHEGVQPTAKYTYMPLVITQIAILDIIFSLDSVLTAIGLTQLFWLMAVAITIAILVMIFASESLSKFIEKYPTIKMLALTFLILIGTVLIADGCHFHIPRGYIYFALAFSIGVESLNILGRLRRERMKRLAKKRSAHQNDD